MPLKETVNALLHRATGYRLTKETPEQRLEAIRLARKRASERAWRRASAQLAAERAAVKRANAQRAAAARRAAEKAAAKRRAKEAAAEKAAADRAAAQRRAEQQSAPSTAGVRLPPHYDDAKRAIIAKVLPRTMTGPPKLEPLVEAVRYVVHNDIPGEIVECGVWRGGSMEAMALTLGSLGETSRELHLFDTFEGMPPPTDEDKHRRGDGTTITAADALATSPRDSKYWAVAGLDDVRAAMDESGYPPDMVHYHVGMVEDTIPGEAPGQIAILRLDTDWYTSTKHELETLYDRLSPGGVLMLDDYGDWEGARKATDEWMEATGERLFLVPMGTGRIALKPPVPQQRHDDTTGRA